MVRPRSPAWLLDVVITNFPSRVAVTPEPALAALRRFHAAGIPIVMGSDSGNWEIIPYEFHGPTSVREVKLLSNAGLSAGQAIQASTRLAAQMIGVAG